MCLTDSPTSWQDEAGLSEEIRQRTYQSVGFGYSYGLGNFVEEFEIIDKSIQVALEDKLNKFDLKSLLNLYMPEE